MDIGALEGYKTALATDKSVLPVILLKERSASVFNSILENGIMPFDRVVISFPDEIDLLPVLWALIKRNVTCIPVDTGIDETALADIICRSQAKYIIKKKHYTDTDAPYEKTIDFEQNAISGISAD